jgi:hypothetical protein
MRFTIFKAKDGDCNLITGSDNTQILVDGGRTTSFTDHVAPNLSGIGGPNLRLVCVSHIDNDHISGVIELLTQKADWVVHHYQLANNNPTHPAPDFAEPADIAEIWHNGFREIVDDNTGRIEDQLAASAEVMSVSTSSKGTELASTLENVATGVKEAVLLQRKLKNGYLNIPHNPQTNGQLLMVEQLAAAVNFGALTIRLIGPRSPDLEKLRDEWNDWLEKNQDKLDNLGNQARQRFPDISLSEGDLLKVRREWIAGELGDFSDLTTPNIASIMFLAREGGSSVLMTGDGASQHVLNGLEDTGEIAVGGRLHVTVLKVPHHGASANTSPEFPKRITADHYVFCGNGAHDNPERDVVEAYINSRFGSPEERSPNAEVGNPFTMWFTYGPESPGLTDGQKAHMKTIYDFVRQREGLSHGQMSSRFLDGDFAHIDL